MVQNSPEGAGRPAQSLYHTSTERANAAQNHMIPRLLIWFIIKSFTCLKALFIKATFKLRLRTKECL